MKQRKRLLYDSLFNHTTKENKSTILTLLVAVNYTDGSVGGHGCVNRWSLAPFINHFCAGGQPIAWVAFYPLRILRSSGWAGAIVRKMHDSAFSSIGRKKGISWGQSLSRTEAEAHWSTQKLYMRVCVSRNTVLQARHFTKGQNCADRHCCFYRLLWRGRAQGRGTLSLDEATPPRVTALPLWGGACACAATPLFWYFIYSRKAKMAPVNVSVP